MDSVAIITRAIRKTNIDMIEKIVKIKNLSKEEHDKLLKDFIKPNYYNPTIVPYKRQESIPSN